MVHLSHCVVVREHVRAVVPAWDGRVKRGLVPEAEAAARGMSKQSVLCRCSVGALTWGDFASPPTCGALHDKLTPAAREQQQSAALCPFLLMHAPVPTPTIIHRLCHTPNTPLATTYLMCSGL